MTVIANRGGHNYQAQGANGYVNEVTEDRKINSATIKYLKALGHSPNDVTPSNRGVDADLIYGVQMANQLNVDIFNSNHLNAHVTCKEAKGCECVTYGDAPSVEIANRVTDNLVKLGFKRRSNKVNKELYEVRDTVAPSVIVEPFFVDSYADVQLYYKVGADAIGKAIAYGLVGKEFIMNDYEKIHVGKYINVKPFNKTFQIFKDDSSWELWNRQTLLGAEDGLSVKILDNLRNHVYKVSHPYGEGYVYVSDLVNNYTVTDYPAFRSTPPISKPVEKLYKIVADGVQKTDMTKRDYLPDMISKILDTNAKEIIISKVQG